jgi:hypothetical protein
MQRWLAEIVVAAGMALWVTQVEAQPLPDVAGLATLTPGRSGAEQGLWIETPLERRFNSSKRVVIADLQGSGTIAMIHFALPASHVGYAPPGTHAGKKLLDRDLLLKMYWEGETTPAVDCPMVDFFCDPAGLREVVNTVLVNKRRGWNAYFPMPYRKSAKIELVYEGPVEPGDELWRIMPAYSYVLYRTEGSIPKEVGYFHACWRQEALRLGERDYLALETKGQGKFVGWNVTVRSPGKGDYPVDENEKFYVDGEPVPSVEFQGIEDSFGFSWGFPESENQFPFTGFFPFFRGAAAYRFFVNDSIGFQQSLKVTIGFGPNEDPMFHREYIKPGSELQLSSTVYWYQAEPGSQQPPLPPPAERAPAPDNRFWLTGGHEPLPSAEDLQKQGVRLYMLCGRPEQEVIFAEPGYGAAIEAGFAYDGWNPPVYHCRASETKLAVALTVPKGAAGTLRVYVIDPDNFKDGRKEEVLVAGKSIGTVSDFQAGRWLEHTMTGAETAEGRVLVEAVNAQNGANAVVSIIEWVEKK